MLLITIFMELRVVEGRSRMRAQSPQAVSQWPCCAVALRRTAWSEHGMASVNQTGPHCVNQMGKTHSKPLVAQHGRGTAWAWNGMCKSAFMLKYPPHHPMLEHPQPMFISYYKGFHSHLHQVTGKVELCVF
jgi:hypothetical protein